MFAIISGFLLILIAKICDVSLAVLKTVCIVRGKKGMAFCLGFTEALIWVFAISKVTQNLDKPYLMIAYALGFALGNYVGITIEGHLALGEQVIRAFSRKSAEVVAALREQGRRVTRFAGEGLDGPVDLILTQVPRKQVPEVIRSIRALDSEAFYFVDDISSTSNPARRRFQLFGWPTFLRRK